MNPYVVNMNSFHQRDSFKEVRNVVNLLTNFSIMKFTHLILRDRSIPGYITPPAIFNRHLSFSITGLNYWIQHTWNQSTSTSIRSYMMIFWFNFTHKYEISEYSSEYPLLSSSEYQCRKRMGLLTVRTWFWRPLVSRVFCSCVANRGARAPELPLPRTHFVTGGGTLQRFPTWQRLGIHSQRCCGGGSAPSMGQNRQPFDDVHPARGDGQSPVTFERRAEISSHTKKCVAPPRLTESKVYPSSPRLKKESRSELYSRKLHGDIHPRRSVDSHSRQKDWRRLTSEQSVIVTCSRSPFLDPVFVQSRPSGTVSLQCIQSQSLSPNTSSSPSIQCKSIKTSSATSRRPSTHARTAIPSPTAGGIDGARRGISCRRHVFHLFSTRLEYVQATAGRNDAGHPMCIQPEQGPSPAAHSSSTYSESSSSKRQTVLDKGLPRNVHTRKCLLQAISSPLKWRGSDKSVQGAESSSM